MKRFFLLLAALSLLRQGAARQEIAVLSRDGAGEKFDAELVRLLKACRRGEA